MPESKAARLNDRLLTGLIVSVFFPWPAAFAVAGGTALLLWIAPATRAALLADKKALLRLSPWLLLATLPPLLWQNWLGLACGGGVLLFFTLYVWLRATLTRDKTLRAMKIACFGGVFAAAVAAVQKVGYLWLGWNPLWEPTLPSNDELRTPSVVGNPNEYAALCVMLILFGLWLWRQRELSLPLTLLTVGSSLVGLFLSASLMAMTGLFFALALMLALEKRWKPLLGLTGLTAALLAALKLFPSLLPHAAGAGHSLEMRVDIWRLAVRMFLKAPVFGRGLLSYWLFSPEYVGQDLGFAVRVTTCAHSLLLDGLLSFGLVGMALAGWYLIRVLKATLRRYLQGDALSVLALAALTAAFVHGLFDVTAVWPQVIIPMAVVVAAATNEGAKEAPLPHSPPSADAETI